MKKAWTEKPGYAFSRRIVFFLHITSTVSRERWCVHDLAPLIYERRSPLVEGHKRGNRTKQTSDLRFTLHELTPLYIKNFPVFRKKVPLVYTHTGRNMEMHDWCGVQGCGRLSLSLHISLLTTVRLQNEVRSPRSRCVNQVGIKRYSKISLYSSGPHKMCRSLEGWCSRYP